MYCIRCGTALPTEAAFCPSCGAPTPRASVSVPAPPASGPAPAPPAYAEAGPAPGRTRFAGFWRRFWAFLIDFFILQVVLFPARMMVDAPSIPLFGGDSIDPEVMLDALRAMLQLLAITTLLTWLYYALMESSSRSATLGKMALGMRVTTLAGERIRFGRATGRYFARIVSTLVLVGYLVQLVTARRQALHDLLAGVVVVRSDGAST